MGIFTPALGARQLEFGDVQGDLSPNFGHHIAFLPGTKIRRGLRLPVAALLGADGRTMILRDDQENRAETQKRRTRLGWPGRHESSPTSEKPPPGIGQARCRSSHLAMQPTSKLGFQSLWGRGPSWPVPQAVETRTR